MSNKKHKPQKHSQPKLIGNTIGDLLPAESLNALKSVQTKINEDAKHEKRFGEKPVSSTHGSAQVSSPEVRSH